MGTMRAHLIMAWLQPQSTRERPDTFTQTAFDSSQEPLQRRGGPYILEGALTKAGLLSVKR